jgi:hypothetical protein
MTMIELDQELESLRCGFVFDAEPVRDLYRAALARVAELESQLAAQGWRPVTEKPPAHDSYLVYRASPPQAEPWRYEFGVWDDSGWDIEAITHWRPLPPAPAAPQE